MNLTLNEMRLESASKQKKGVHFILASVIIWSFVLIIHLTELPILTKNLLTFFVTAPLVPIAFLISKLIKIDFTNKDNPLTNLGVLFSVNQMLYLLIAMWIFNAVPEKMVMVLAMIFGAHLLPFGWLYQSKSYMVMSVIISILALIVGVNFSPYLVAAFMVAVEIIFSLLLFVEIKKLPVSPKNS
jgi:hypothetical protein